MYERNYFKVFVNIFIGEPLSLIMAVIKCKNCGREIGHHAKGMCTTCYKKLAWQPEIIKCKRCERERPMHAKGLCRGCYNYVFHINDVKAWHCRKLHNISIETYKKITKNCVICGFDKVVDLHHLDENRKNNNEVNLIGLCPNHHKMLHDFRYKSEIFKLLKEKNYKVPELKVLDYKNKV